MEIRRSLAAPLVASVVAAELALCFLAPASWANVLLMLATAPTAIGGFVGARKFRQGITFLLPVGLAEAAGVVMGFDRVTNDGPIGVFGGAAGVTAAILVYAGVVGLLRLRRPKTFADGLLDGFAALAALVVMRWQWLAMTQGRDVVDVAKQLTPFLAASLLVCVMIVFGGLARDKRQDLRVLMAMSVGAAGLVAGQWLSKGYGAQQISAAAVATTMIGTTLIGLAFVDRGIATMFEPEEVGRRRFSMRWMGPVLALMATPLSMTMFVVRHHAPTVPVVAAAIALTGLALWRGRRMVKQQEEQRRKLAVEQGFRALVEHAADVILILNQRLEITYASGGVGQLVGREHERIVGASIETALNAEDAKAIAKLLNETSGTQRTVTLGRDVRLMRPDGQSRWVTATFTDHSRTPALEGWVVNLHDVTERKQAEEALSRLALHDALTGLPNRAQMIERVTAAIESTPGNVSILFCDLDGFKDVNDTYGHERGDELLRAVAGRWSAVLRSEDVLARWGGDEFLVLSPGLNTREEVNQVIERLAQAITAPIELSCGPVQIGCSIGSAVHEHDEGLDHFVERSDHSMYVVKRSRYSPTPVNN